MRPGYREAGTLLYPVGGEDHDEDSDEEGASQPTVVEEFCIVFDGAV